MVYASTPADADGSYDEFCAKLERITRSISQLRRYDEIDYILTTFPYNYIFHILVSMLLAYVFYRVF